MMFGRKTKADLQFELEAVAERLQDAKERGDRLERRLREAVVQLEFWKNYATEMGGQVEFWQRKNRELLAELTKDATEFDLKAYAKSIEQAVIDARPNPAAIAAVIASCDRDVQGLSQRRPVQAIDVSGSGSALAVVPR